MWAATRHSSETSPLLGRPDGRSGSRKPREINRLRRFGHPASGAGGRRFESCLGHHETLFSLIHHSQVGGSGPRVGSMLLARTMASTARVLRLLAARPVEQPTQPRQGHSVLLSARRFLGADDIGERSDEYADPVFRLDLDGIPSQV